VPRGSARRATITTTAAVKADSRAALAAVAAASADVFAVVVAPGVSALADPTLKFKADTRAALAAAATAAMMLAAPGVSAAADLTLKFKASPDPAIRAAQQELVESWALASALFVDADAISKPEWHESLTKALDASFALGGSDSNDGSSGRSDGSSSSSRSSGSRSDGVSAAAASPVDGVHALEDGVLAQLGDPFTRVLRGRAAERLAQEEEGRVVSNGLALLPAGRARRAGAGAGAGGGAGWAVAYVAPGGPAEAAGVRAGDVLLALDGAAPPRADAVAYPSSSAGARKAAREAFLARVAREPVTLRLSRAAAADVTQAAPAAPAAPAPFDARLSPRSVDVDSVQWGLLRVRSQAPPLAAAATPAPAGAAGAGAGAEGEGGRPVAYLRIAQFSQRTPAAVREAMEGMFGSGAAEGRRPRALLVDLRDNPGGVVEAGVEAARQLLKPGDALAVVSARSGGAMSAETSSERVVLSPVQAAGKETGAIELPALYRYGGSGSSGSGSGSSGGIGITGARPAIAVLTNHNTASTAELLAGALRDGGPGAEIVGERTYGKGKTQRVVELKGGAGGADPAAAAASAAAAGGGRATLLVSTMRFATPAGAPIDGVGLAPQVACASPAAGFEVFEAGGADSRGDDAMRALLEGDACVRRAAERLANR